MKNILLILVLFICYFGDGIAQGLCPTDNNNISTNPNAPVNDHNSNMANSFFDWTQMDLEPYFNPNYKAVIEPTWSHINPYWSNQDYLVHVSGYDPNHPNESEADFYPNEGWEVIHRGLGLTIDGEISEENGFFPYFMLYNKFTGILRFWFGIPSSIVGAQFQSFEVELSFGGIEGNYFITGLFGHNGLVSQSLDQETSVLKLSGIANHVEAGWMYADFAMAYDPCTCIATSQLMIEVTAISFADAKMTGLLVGTSTSIPLFNELNGGGFEFVDEDRLMSVIKSNEINPEIGVESYKRINEFIQAASEVSPDLQNHLHALGEILATSSGIFGFVSKGLKNNKTIKDALDGVGKIFKFLGTSFTDKSQPNIIEAEIALTGKIETENNLERTNIHIHNPGTSPATNNVEYGNSLFPAYPFFNKTMGTFALLETPDMKEALLESVTTSDELFDFTTNTYQVQLNESTIEYVFNPNMGLNLDKSRILAALAVEGYILEEDGSVLPGIGMDYDYIIENPEEGVNQKHVFSTPLMPLECIGDFVGHYEQIINNESGGAPLPPPVFYLRLAFDYEFYELNRNGDSNKTMQIITYPVNLLPVPLTEITNNLEGVEDEITLTGGVLSEDVMAFSSITIAGDISATP